MLRMTGRHSLRYLLKPYAKGLAIGIAAVIVEGAAGVAEPWPLKIVIDNVVKSKPAQGWWSGLLFSGVSGDRAAILKFAALAVLLIAAIGAIASYTEKYLTATIGQRVVHDLRQTLYCRI